MSWQGYRREWLLDEQKGRTQVANLTMPAVALVFVLFLTSLLAVILSLLVGRLRTYGVLERIDADRIFPGLSDVFAAFEAQRLEDQRFGAPASEGA